MDWGYIIVTVLTSGIIVSLIEWWRFKHKDNADARNTDADTEGKISDNAMRYADKIEERLGKMEEKVDRMESKIIIYQRAINCAYRCGNVLKPEEECPVIIHLNENENDEKTSEENS